MLKILSEAALRLLYYAAPSMPVPMLVPDITPRNAARLERRKSADKAR